MKVGDTVKIKEVLEDKHYSGVVSDMKAYSGKTAKIESALYGRNNIYRLDIDGGKWSWNDTMFEKDFLHDFKWALEQVKEGKKVRRKDWITTSPHGYLYCDSVDNDIIINMVNSRSNIISKGFRKSWLDRTDWELYEEETLSEHITKTPFYGDMIPLENIKDYIRIAKRDIKKGKDPLETLTKLAGPLLK